MSEQILFYFFSTMAIVTSALVIGQRNPMHSVLLLVASFAMISGLYDRTPRRMMLIADKPAPGLSPNEAPDLDSVPNNHLAYGVQWFLFAGVAGIIYVLALRRRAKTA